jgi:hypothetical protein
MRRMSWVLVMLLISRCLQSLSEAIPEIEGEVNAFRYSLTPDAAECHSLQAHHTSSHTSAALHTGRAPLRNIHNRGNAGTPHGGAEVRGGGVRSEGPAEDGLERAHAAKDRLQRLLATINHRPRECANAVLQLAAAVTAVPPPAWEARPSFPSYHSLNSTVARE